MRPVGCCVTDELGVNLNGPTFKCLRVLCLFLPSRNLFLCLWWELFAIVNQCDVSHPFLYMVAPRASLEKGVNTNQFNAVIAADMHSITLLYRLSETDTVVRKH